MLSTYRQIISASTPFTRKFSTISLLVITLFFSLTPANVRANEIIIGLLAHNGIETSLKQWQATANYLSEQIDGFTFKFAPYDELNELSSAAKRGEFDYVITNPSSYVEMELNSGASRILTLINKRQGKPYTQFGSVIFTRTDRTDIMSLNDLRGKTLTAVSEPAFGGWLVALGELIKQGIDHKKDLKKVSFAGSQHKVVYAVRDGQSDAGIVRTDMLERMAERGLINLSDFRGIGQRYSENFPFMRSTELYPEWSFAKFPQAPTDLSKKVARELLALSPDSLPAMAGKYMGWSVPLNYQPVHELLKTLEVEPYKDYGKVSLKETLFIYRYWIIAVASTLLILFATATFALTRSHQLALLRSTMLDDKDRELNFQRLAVDEHAIVSITDTNGNIIYMNDKFREISGYSHDELMGKNHCILKSGEHGPEFYKDLWQTVERGEAWHGNIKNKKKNGEYFWVKATIVPFLNKEGKPFQYVAIHTDITGRKIREEKISQFKRTLDLTQDCIFMFWPETLKLFYVNQGAMKQIGYSESELLSMMNIEIMPEYDETDFRDMVQPLINGSQRAMTFETVHEHQSGDQIPVEISLQYIAPTGEDPRFVAIVRDITERKIIDNAKSEFISTVSHELRTPLTSIRGALGLLSSGSLGELPEKMGPMLELAENNTSRLILLVNDLLDIEKLQSGQITFRMEKTSLTQVVSTATEANRPYADEQKVTFELTDIVADAFVRGDRERLAQVMANLLSNAAKFSPDGETVNISLVRNANGFRVSVSDRGLGVPEKFREQLFDRFTQADASDTRQKGGTGLGLNISRTIVEKHDGRINLISTEGDGATFYFEIPEYDEEPHSIIDTGFSAKEIGKTGVIEGSRILVIEDDPDVARLVAIILEQYGAICDVAHDVATAKNKIAATRYNAITLDILLPDGNGIDFLQGLRDANRTKDIPVIVLSAVANESRENVLTSVMGVMDWLDKPIDENRLIRAIKRGTDLSTNDRSEILIVEDDTDLTKVLGTLIGDLADVTVAETLKQAQHELESNRWSLVILDIGLPDGSGLDLLPLLKNNGGFPTPVIIFTGNKIDAETTNQVEAVLIKSQTSNEELLASIETLILNSNSQTN